MRSAFCLLAHSVFIHYCSTIYLHFVWHLTLWHNEYFLKNMFSCASVFNLICLIIKQGHRFAFLTNCKFLKVKELKFLCIISWTISPNQNFRWELSQITLDFKIIILEFPSFSKGFSKHFFSSGDNFVLHLNITNPAMYVIIVLSPDSRTLLEHGIDLKSGKCEFCLIHVTS